MTLFSAEQFRPFSLLIVRHQRIVLRVALVVPVAIAVGVVTWSLQRLQPVLKETSKATDRLTQISSQVDEMERSQMRMEKDGVEQKFSTLVAGYASGEESVREWLTDLREKAVPLAFELNTDIGEPEKHEVSGETFTLIPIRIELQPSGELTSPRGSYQRLMEFCRFITAHRLRADVSEFTVAGNTGEIGRAILTVHLWARTTES